MHLEESVADPDECNYYKPSSRHGTRDKKKRVIRVKGSPPQNI